MFCIVLKFKKVLTFVKIEQPVYISGNPIAMALTAKSLNKLLMFKLPSAFLCGVRVSALDKARCETTVTHKWINQNPFESMYFAVQAMAAELSTGALVMYHIDLSKANVSMLVGSCHCKFSKKAKGKIDFRCVSGNQVAEALAQAISTGDGVLCRLTSIATDAAGDIVSEMEFEWTFKLRKSHPSNS